METKSHSFKVKTIITHFDAMGNVKYERVLENKKPKENTIDFIVRSKAGIILKEVRGIPARSYVAEFMKSIYHCCVYVSAPQYENVVDGVGWSTTATGLALRGSTAYQIGIVLGSGTTGVDINDYKLATLIGLGTGAGQLSHGDNLLSEPAVDGSSYKNVITRTFVNNSGATISIREAGLYAGATISSALTGVHLLARDISNKNSILLNIDLLDGQSVEFKYNQYLDLSEGFVKGYAAFMYTANYALATTVYSTLDTDGDTVAVRGEGKGYWGEDALITDSSFGIVVGTGGSAIVLTNNQSEGKIIHGTGAGQLLYSAVTVKNAFSEVGQVTSFSIARVFTNNSGAQVIIKNMGIVKENNGSTVRILVLNKLTGNIVLENGEPVQIEQVYESTTS